MTLFRTRLSFIEAVDRLAAIIRAADSPPDLNALAPLIGVEPWRIAKHLAGLSIFTVHLATKLTRSSGWRKNGELLFESLLAQVTKDLSTRYDDFDWNLQLSPNWMHDCFAMYNSSLMLCTNDPTPSKIAREMGEGFRSFLVPEAPSQVVTDFGARMFSSVWNAVMDLHKGFALRS